MNRKIKVLVIDDHPLFREGIKAILGEVWSLSWLEKPAMLMPGLS